MFKQWIGQYLYLLTMHILLSEIIEKIQYVPLNGGEKVDLSEDFNTQTHKYIASGMRKDVVDRYIERFKKIRDAKFKVARDADIEGLKVPKGSARFDIDKYLDFNQLETFVDYVSGQVQGVATTGTHFTDIKVDGKPLGQKNGLEIYYAKDKHACIAYKGNKPYSWCVARSDAGNMYNTYRYKHHEPTFYFVKDVEATKKEFEHPFEGEFKNPWHFFVIQRTADGYIVTSANNDGDKEMTWDEIVKVQPKLKGMEEYFKHVPLTPQERERYEKFINGMDDAQFAKLSYEDKEAYLDIAIGHTNLTAAQFNSLPEPLKNKFIGFGMGLDDDQYELVKKDKNLYKRFFQISVRKFLEYKKNPDIYLQPSEWDVLVNSHETKGLFKDMNIYMFNSMMTSCKNVDKVVEVLGKEKFLEWATVTNNKQVESLDGANLLKFVSLVMERDPRIEWNFYKFSDKSEETIKAVFDIFLKYRPLTTKEVELGTPFSAPEKLGDYILDLFAHSKIKVDSWESASDLCIKLMRSIDPKRVINAMGMNVANHISPESMASLVRWYRNHGKEDKLISAVGLGNIRRVRGYALYNAIGVDSKHLQEYVKLFGKDILNTMPADLVTNMIRLSGHAAEIYKIGEIFSNVLEDVKTHDMETTIMRSHDPSSETIRAMGGRVWKKLEQIL
jgi:hypothetical protein